MKAVNKFAICELLEIYYCVRQIEEYGHFVPGKTYDIDTGEEVI